MLQWGMVMDLWNWDGWASAILSGIAILVGIALAWIALWQSHKVASSQAFRDNENYLTGRMQELIDHARAIVMEAGTIQDLTSPRLTELLSFPDDGARLVDDDRREVRTVLSRLSTQVELLRVYAITMPKVNDEATGERTALNALMDEGAWLSADALHVAILRFATDADDLDDVDLGDRQSVADALLNGSFVNLDTRLLSDCIGMDPDSVPSYSEPGSPWPAVYQRREEVLLTTVLANTSWTPRSLTEAATWSLSHTTNRFQDALMALLTEWDALRSKKS